MSPDRSESITPINSRNSGSFVWGKSLANKIAANLYWQYDHITAHVSCSEGPILALLPHFKITALYNVIITIRTNNLTLSLMNDSFPLQMLKSIDQQWLNSLCLIWKVFCSKWRTHRELSPAVPFSVKASFSSFFRLCNPQLYCLSHYHCSRQPCSVK